LVFYCLNEMSPEESRNGLSSNPLILHNLERLFMHLLFRSDALHVFQ